MVLYHTYSMAWQQTGRYCSIIDVKFKKLEFRGNSGKIDPVLLEGCSLVYFEYALGLKCFQL